MKTEQEIIEHRLLHALQDEDVVACLLSEDDIETVDKALRIAWETTGLKRFAKLREDLERPSHIFAKDLFGDYDEAAKKRYIKLLCPLDEEE